MVDEKHQFKKNNLESTYLKLNKVRAEALHFHKKNIHNGQSKSLLCLPATSVDGVVLCALHLLTRSYQSTKVPHLYIVSSTLQSHSEYFFNVYIQRKEKKTNPLLSCLVFLCLLSRRKEPFQMHQPPRRPRPLTWFSMFSSPTVPQPSR